jgi:hypothetical protein
MAEQDGSAYGQMDAIPAANATFRRTVIAPFRRLDGSSPSRNAPRPFHVKRSETTWPSNLQAEESARKELAVKRPAVGTPCRR